MLFEESTARPSGKSRLAAVAAPPSPQAVVGFAQTLPAPATVEMFCVVASTVRILLSFASAMYRLPALSSASPSGRFSEAWVAGPPAPPTLVECAHFWPLPA